MSERKNKMEEAKQPITEDETNSMDRRIFEENVAQAMSKYRHTFELDLKDEKQKVRKLELELEKQNQNFELDIELAIEKLKLKRIIDLKNISDLPAKNVPCSVCLENLPIIVFGCGHKKTCAKCSLYILQSTNICPHCRKKITSAIRVYE